MATKIRLQRFGRKNLAYFHIVVADSHSPRDGKFIERLGNYNPNTNPATIDLNFDRALFWYSNGAVPTDTMKAVLSYKGIVYKNHLLKGVKKGALTMEQVEEKFNKWLEEKNAKVEAKKNNIVEGKHQSRKAAIEAETKVNQARAERIAAKKKAELEALVAANTEAAATEETPAEETTETAPSAE